MTNNAFVYVTYIAAAPENVWEALTSPDFTQQYWGGMRIQSDWRPGSPVQHIKDDGSVDWEGEVIEADPPRRLAYTFNCAGRTGTESRVTMRIESYGEVVRLTVTHEGYEPGSKDYEGIAMGWPAILSSMKSLLERGEALSYPWKG